MKELVIEARRDNLLTVQSFIEEQLEAYDCPVATLTTIGIAVEELFVNIANYAYAPEVGNAVIQVAVHGDPPAAEIRFIDCGVPYNPLETPAPDTTLALNQRKKGGLGIYMVKNSMDDIFYAYKDGKNILTVKKKIY